MIFIPVVLSAILGPGMGQLYNREYKKGIYLVILSLIAFIGAGIWLRNMLIPYLPTDITTEDPMELSRMIQANTAKATSEHSGILFCYALLLTAIWVYSVVDAYLGGKRRMAEQKAKMQNQGRPS